MKPSISSSQDFCSSLARPNASPALNPSVRVAIEVDGIHPCDVVFRCLFNPRSSSCRLISSIFCLFSRFRCLLRDPPILPYQCLIFPFQIHCIFPANEIGFGFNVRMSYQRYDFLVIFSCVFQGPGACSLCGELTPHTSFLGYMI